MAHTKLTNGASISALLREMTTEEKIDLLTGAGAFSSPAMPKYGIPSVLYLDGATGVNLMQYVCEFAGSVAAALGGGQAAPATESLDSASSNESGGSVIGLMKLITSKEPLPETIPDPFKRIIHAFREKLAAVRPNGEEPNCFPPGMLLGATWDPDAVEKVAHAVAREASAYGVDVLLGTPNTNIHRDPRNGRLFESFSEDPYLSSRMALRFSRGVQAEGVVADVKHFAANNQETLRQGIDEQISERALREIYLPGFEAAVREGGAMTVMSAYNSINGVPCAHNKWLLTDVLKKEWGFSGQVVSDWGAVYDQVTALNAGNDMDMPGPRGKQRLYDAAADGTLDLARLDDAVERTLRTILQTPAFTGKRMTAIDDAYSETAAYHAAAEGITLLKNDGVLPLKRGERLALFGRCADRLMESGSGSAQVDTSKGTRLPEELSRYTDFVTRGGIGEEDETVLIVVGASGQEGKDRPDLHLDAEDERLLDETLTKAKAANKKTAVLLNVTGPVELLEYLDRIDALLCLYFPGGQGARAAADILFGAVSPSGKLPLTWPRTYRQTPTAFNFPGEYGKVNYGEGIFVGYRYYDYKGMEPLFPFGFGLSYSSFSFSDAAVSSGTYDNSSREPLRVSVTVTNTGTAEAKEVVQLYIHAVKSALLKPERELKAFQKLSLKPGEQKRVTLELLPRSFASYDTELGTWTVEPGRYELLIGDSSRNLPEAASVHITGRDPYGPSIRTAIAEVLRSEAMLSALRHELGDSFDTARIKSAANYFGSTRLCDFLRNNRMADEEQLLRLDARFAAMDGGDQHE